MRLLVLTHRLPYAPNRGDRIRAFHLLRLLAREHEVHLVSLIHDSDEASHIDSIPVNLASVRGAHVSRLRTIASAAAALPTSRPLTHALLNSPQFPALLRQTVASARPDAVLAYCTSMAQFVFQEPLAGLPFVLDMVDLDSEKWATLAGTHAPPLSWIYRREARVLRAFERRAVMRAVATTVVSDREKELAASALAVSKELTVAPNGIDVQAFASQRPPAQSQNVVFCGVFNYKPNEQAAQWIAREVWPHVKQAQPGACLRLVGMLPSRAVQALAQPGSIEVTGAVPDVRPYLWDAAAAAAPLKLARGVQNKVLEAIAAGLACVVTPQVYGGLPAAARTAVDQADSAREFAAALISLLRCDPDERRRRAMQVDLVPLSWEKQLSPILDICRRL